MSTPDDFGVSADRGHALLWERHGAEVMFRVMGPEPFDDGGHDWDLPGAVERPEEQT